jgi:dihydroflavonol-4-reductase
VRIFVTGSTGFIGRRLVDRLARDGHEVTALARGEARGLAESVRVVKGDILDPASLRAVSPAGEGFDRLFHLAALVTFDPRRRAELLAVNGQGTANVLAAAREWGVKRSVVASSACTIGISRSPGEVLDETAAPNPALARRNPYLAGKLACEEAAAQVEGMEAVIVNPTTVFGPGDYSLNSGTLILKVARGRVIPAPPGGGNAVDVDDVVDGLLAAGERGRPGRRYILGGENLLYREMFKIVAEAAGRRPWFVRLPKIARGPAAAAAWVVGRLTGSRFVTPQIVEDLFAYKYYSSRRAAEELGWTPRRRFRESVERAWAFYREQGLIRS